MKIKAYSQFDINRLVTRVALIKHTEDGKIFAARSLEWVEVDPGVIREDTWLEVGDSPGQLRDETLQALLDLMWRLKMRPTGFEDVSGELTSTKYHLEDMRRLVFKKKR